MTGTAVTPRATPVEAQAALVKTLALAFDRMPPRVVALAFANFILSHAIYLYPNRSEPEALALASTSALAELEGWAELERAWLPGRLAEIFGGAVP